MRQIEPPFHAPAPYGDPDLSRRLLPYVPNEHLRRDPAETSQLHDYLMILRHRWKLIAGFTVAGLVMMGFVSLMSRPLYTAQAVLHVENRAPAITNFQQIQSAPTYLVEGVEYFQDQINYLESRSLAAAVIKDLALDKDERFLDKRGFNIFRFLVKLPSKVMGFFTWLVTPSQPGIEGDEANAQAYGVDPLLIGKYQFNLLITPVVNSRLIQVSFTSPSRELARQIADAHAALYIRKGLQAKFELTGEAKKFLENEIDRVQKELGVAEAALNDFRRQHQVISLDDNENAIVERLRDLSRRVTEAQADRITAESDYRLVQNREYDSLPAIINNQLVNGLKAEVGRLETQQAQVAEVFLGGSPQLQEINSQLRQAKSRLDREIARAVGGVESIYLAAQAREKSLGDELTRQQDMVLDQKEVSGQFIKLETAVNTTRTLYGTLLQRKAETDVVKGVTLSNASVMDPAELPIDPSYPKVPLNLAFGLLFGCVLGTALALVMENLDSSLKTPDDVRRSLRLPTLGVVPDFGKLSATPTAAAPLPLEEGETRAVAVPNAEVLSLTRRQSVPAEAYRSIRTSILFLNPEAPLRTLLITSSEPREGKTATTVNLAISLAQLGNRVVVIDADLRAPRCHRALGVPAGPGLAEVLRGQAELSNVVLALNLDEGRITVGNGDGEARLHLLQSGRPPGDPSELIASARMRDVLRTLTEQYDMVLIDSPPVFPITDSAILAPVVDGVVLVVRGHRTNRQITTEALERLHFMKANVVGCVLNGVDPGSGYYRSYSYYFAA
jgi:capsular exopolysaccharide synthesis family protein